MVEVILTLPGLSNQTAGAEAQVRLRTQNFDMSCGSGGGFGAGVPAK